MEDLKVTLVQANLFWEGISGNISHLTQLTSTIDKTDIIVLPEMFTTGFSMNAKQFAEPMDGPAVRWMIDMAGQKDAVLTGSLIISENDKYFNRLLWVTPDGKIQHYDKRHLFAFGDEHINYSPGPERLTVEWKGWKIRPLICYDLRFPVWARNHDNYDLLLFVANWPSARHHVWKNLLVARAIENQCWCAAVNRVGTDGMKLNYLGDSAVIDAKGKAVFIGEGEKVQSFFLSLKELHDFRKKFPVLSDRDDFELL